MTSRDDRIRCFLAANVAAEPLANLQALQGRLRDALAPTGLPIRWVPTENVHLTFKFLGNVGATALPAIERELRRALQAEAALAFDIASVGAFPTPKRPRVIWAGVRDPAPDRLAALHARIEQVFSELGFDREARPFQPHLTLARVKDDVRRDISERLAPFAAVEVGRTVVGELVLYRSELTPGGARYTVLRRIPLRENP